MNKINISVEEGGERLYLYPFCAKEGEKHIIFPPIQEFPPGGNDWYFLNTSFYPGLKWLKVKYNFLRFANSLYYAFRKVLFNLKYRYFHGLIEEFFSDIKHYYSISPPVLGAEFYGVFSISSQLTVNDPDGYTDSYYLSPSEKYLELRLEQLLQNYLDNKDKYGNVNSSWAPESAQIAKNYINWRTQKLKEGYEIRFLYSLDT